MTFVCCRILVFAQKAVSTVKVQVDNVYLGEAQHSSGPLYVLEWEPFRYLGGLHNIMVQAVVCISTTFLILIIILITLV